MEPEDTNHARHQGEWTFFAPNATNRDDFLCAQEPLQRAADAIQKYITSGALDKHSELEDASQVAMDARLSDVAEIFCERHTRYLADLISNTRNRLFPDEANRPAVQAQVAIIRVVRTFSVYRKAAGLLTWKQVVQSVRLSLFRKPIRTGSLSSGFLSKLFRRTADECMKLPDHEVACAVLRTLAERNEALVTLLAICVPEWISPDDLLEDPLWLDHYISAPVNVEAEKAETTERIRQFTAAKKVHHTANRKFHHAIARILELNLTTFDPTSGDRVSSIWAFLRMAYVEHVLAEACHKREFYLTNAFLRHTKAYMSSPVVWQLFFANFNLHPEQILEGIEEYIERPKRFARWQVSSDALVGFKHQFKGITEVVLGDIRSTVQFKHLLRELEQKALGTWARVYLVAQFMAFAATHHRNNPSLLTRMESAIVDALGALPRVLKSAACEISAISLRTPDDEEWQRLVQAEAAAERLAHTELERWLVENSPQAQVEVEEPAVVEASDSPIPVGFTYVFKLGAAHESRETAFNSSVNQFPKDLDEFLTTHGIEVIVPVHSVARALHHYFLMSDPERRECTTNEEISSIWWRKLKRGRQRIYIRERDGVFFVHLLKRKNWEHAH